jgi:hypothetical protein
LAEDSRTHHEHWQEPQAHIEISPAFIARIAPMNLDMQKWIGIKPGV